MKGRRSLFSVIMYGAIALSVFIVGILMVGMVAYFAKTFYHIQPTWFFGLFD